jgi:CMP/dCMP kinase
MVEKKLVIAIDGFSSSGKSTVAKTLAKKLGYIYIDSGAMYRCVTLYALRYNLIGDDFFEKQKLINQLSKIDINFKYNSDTRKYESFMNGENVEREIRGLNVSDFVSLVSTVKEVRQKLVKKQQEMGKKGGIVMDGRDIGTVVFPNADLKIFMKAKPETRAQRRYNELKNKGEKIDYKKILENVKQRDHIDSNREQSPLRKADDAVELDNSNMNPEEQLKWVMNKVNKLV